MIALKEDKPHMGTNEQSLLRALVTDVNRRLNPTQREIAEQRYLGLFQFIDLTKDFFFSYTYDLTRTLQHNMAVASPIKLACVNPQSRAMHTWNSYLGANASIVHEQHIEIGLSVWVITLIHGAFVQRRCSFFGQIAHLYLLARRSRHFAGTRYLKRGVSDAGHVANDVELEQIVHEERAQEGVFSSFSQMRGSIPIFWTQETSVTMPKPPIVLNRIDPTYAATRLHFADLFRRYSAPILILDLTKQTERREREMIVSHEFRRAIEHLNVDTDDGETQGSQRIRYCALDFSQVSKHRDLNVLDALEDVAKWSLHELGFFCSRPVALSSSITKTLLQTRMHKHRARQSSSAAVECQALLHSLQLGVVRTNCIDCLDRTNVAQFTIGAHALSQMLATVGASSSPVLESSNPAILVLMELYSTVGDLISLQYGGSEAHKKMSQQPSAGDLTGTTLKHKDLLTSIRRYYSNAFTDRLKQDAINIFLGNFVPAETTTESHDLWELESDYYLHNFHVQSGTVLSMRARRDRWLSTSSTDEDIQRGRCRSSGSAHVGEAVAPLLWRRARVERRCKRQTALLQKWWRDSIKEFESSSEWHLSRCLHEVSETELAPMSRFERLHQPHKITQFDKVFSYDFMVPISLTKEVPQSTADPLFSRVHDNASESIRQTAHSPMRNSRVLGSMKSVGPSAALVAVAAAAVSELNCDDVVSKPDNSETEASEMPPSKKGVDKKQRTPCEDSKITLRRFVRELFPRTPPTIPEMETDNCPIQLHNSTLMAVSGTCEEHQGTGDIDGGARQIQSCQAVATPSDVTITPRDVNRTFITAISSSQEIEDGYREYGDYVRLALDPSILATEDVTSASPHATSFESANVLGELSFRVKAWDVDAHDVGAVREAAQSAGIARVIPRGTYEGLPRSTPARDVIAIIYEELDAIAGIDRDRISSRASMDSMRVLATVIAPRLHQRVLFIASPRCQEARGQDSNCMAGQIFSTSPRGKLRANVHFDMPAVVEQIALTLAKLSAVNEVYSEYLRRDLLSSPHSTYISERCCSLCPILCCSCSSRRHVTTQPRSCYADVVRGDSSARRYSAIATEIERPGMACVGKRRLEIPLVFERISTDLYARRTNKYMLFNCVAAEGAALFFPDVCDGVCDSLE
mmetsp:Transcript_6949/g.22601  ORF Transcript_6949/g.22601 Transcript_6949/m.22601 type:complete len:1149 (+) Transcript_6949:549-3995(+)